MKLLLPSEQIKNIRRQHPCHRDEQCKNNPSFFSKIKVINEQIYSKILELRIAYVNRLENITFEYYLTKPKSMLEWKLLARFVKNPEIVRSFDYKQHNHPLFREFFDIYIDDFITGKGCDECYTL